MKIAIVFEIPDDEAGEMAALAGQLIAAHRFAKEQNLPHWSFNQQMRPLAAAVSDHDDDLIERISQAVDALPAEERS